MIIYRITNSKYKDDLSGYGSFLFGGRWNSKQVYALYAAEHISLAVLEIAVNYDRGASPLLPSYHLIELNVPDQSLIALTNDDLKVNWKEDVDYTRFIGDHFLKDASAFILQVPSAVISEEYNYLLNPSHADFKKIKIKSSKPYGIDNRLFG